jgi:hypothetical protein
MPTHDQTCFVSTVKNISGGTKRFSFLPPHGMQLDNNEEVSIVGNIIEAVGRGDRGDGKRARQALLNAVDAGHLEIIATPSPVLENASGDPMVLVISGSSLTLENPCWESLSGDWPE